MAGPEGTFVYPTTQQIVDSMTSEGEEEDAHIAEDLKQIKKRKRGSSTPKKPRVQTEASRNALKECQKAKHAVNVMERYIPFLQENSWEDFCRKYPREALRVLNANLQSPLDYAKAVEADVQCYQTSKTKKAAKS